MDDKENSGFDEYAFKLDQSYQAMIKEQELLKLLNAELIIEAKALINEQYRDYLPECSESAIRQIDFEIWDHVSDLTVAVVNIFHQES